MRGAQSAGWTADGICGPSSRMPGRSSEMLNDDRDVQAYLARIRKTIAESENLVSQAELRIAETDRMLESQGLTREQVLNFHFTQAQREAVNEELKRRGLDPLAEWESDIGRDALDEPHVSNLASEDFAPDAELAERQRKFGLMMKPFQI